MIKDKKSHVTLPYIMLHTFALIVWALGLYALYVSKELSKPIGSKFYVVHLYTIDTWAYVVAAVLFALQWLTAVFAYMLPFLRKVGLPLGRMFSLYTALAISIALIAEANQQAVQLLYVYFMGGKKNYKKKITNHSHRVYIYGNSLVRVITCTVPTCPTKNVSIVSHAYL